LINTHPFSDVKSNNIGDGTVIWQFAVILEGAAIGSNCNINCHTFIENDVSVGDNVTVKSGVYLWDGIVVENNVFIGPNVTFTNDRYPRSKQYPLSFQKTVLQKGCSIGANSTILGGITIGSHAIIGEGSLITKNIPPFALAYGSPATVKGWVDAQGNKLTAVEPDIFRDVEGSLYQVINYELIKK